MPEELAQRKNQPTVARQQGLALAHVIRPH
jgi:hypothetical protein